MIYIFLIVWCYCSAIIPWFRPAVIAFLWWLILQWYDPHVLSLLATWAALAWTVTIRFCDEMIDRWLQKVIILLKKWQKKILDLLSIDLSRLSFPESVSEKKQELQEKFHKKISQKNHRRRVILIAAYTFQSPLPDVLIIKYIRHHMPFWVFFLSALWWKAFAYTPFIYWFDVVEWFLEHL